MTKLIRMIRLAVMRQRLARVTAEIEQIEHYRSYHQRHLDALIRQAGNLRAELWYVENPRPPAGTTLRGLNAPISLRSGV